MVEFPQAADHKPVSIWQVAVAHEVCIEVSHPNISDEVVEEG